MNEYFSADPQSCDSAFELRHLLSLFGHFTGRFLARYPENWESRLEDHIAKGRPVELKRVRELLCRAIRQRALLAKSSMEWIEKQQWPENAARYVDCQPPILDGLIIPRNTYKPSSKAYTLDELELPPTSGERIRAVPSEYIRVAKTFLLVSREIAIVDPYFNLCDMNVAAVASELFTTLAKGKCASVKCFARAKAILGDDGRTSISTIQAALNNIARPAFAGRQISIKYVLFDDSRSRNRMHDRYLLSLDGGVEFSQGFVQLPHGRRIQVDPVALAPHADLKAIYMEGRHDMKVVHAFSI